jgi:hypothetical protein
MKALTELAIARLGSVWAAGIPGMFLVYLQSNAHLPSEISHLFSEWSCLFQSHSILFVKIFLTLHPLK